MKQYFLVLAAIGLFSALYAAPSDALLDAIAMVESRCSDSAVGDNGRAIGRYQLHKEYVDEVNRILQDVYKKKESFSYRDRTDPEKSRRMVKIYLAYWGWRYEMWQYTRKGTYVPCGDSDLAKIHNGHAFWKRSGERYLANIERYAMKVSQALASDKSSQKR